MAGLRVNLRGLRGAPSWLRPGKAPQPGGRASQHARLAHPGCTLPRDARLGSTAFLCLALVMVTYLLDMLQVYATKYLT